MNSTDGEGRLRIKSVRSSSPLTRLQPNLPFRDVRGSWLVRGCATLPEGIALARKVARQLPMDELHTGSWTELIVVDALRECLEATPGGTAQVARGEGVVIQREGDFRRITITSTAKLDGAGEWKSLPRQSVENLPLYDYPVYPALLPRGPRMFVGGLISLSAEPPEGFFAAATSAELSEQGFPLSKAFEADVWLYRVPDSRSESYFEFLYPSPDRPQDCERGGKFLIASGLGPSSDPTSQGGREASLLWLGDEQHGTLIAYLRELSQPRVELERLAGHRGLAQKLPDGTLFLSGIDHTHNLSKDGFEGLKTDPAIYRKVFSREYDEFLRSLFEPLPGAPARASYLLATSRGCTQGCAICCSGGLKAFQSFSAARMMRELSSLVRAESLRADESIDVFFLDSNFNNNPNRLIEFAQLYRGSEFYGQFRFYVRHNTVKGFLKRVDGANVPNRELVQAFSTLGIREVFMGVDTFDEASTLTLKSNRVQLARRGDQVSATYTPAELRALVQCLEEHGLVTKAFYLQNNPWVSDFDRLDSYYNIADLWFNFPHFSIDTRERAVNQLKPFAGSPIQKVDSMANGNWTSEGRFFTGSRVGELDEMMSLSYFGTPRYRSDPHQVARQFVLELDRVRAAVGNARDNQLLAKIIQLDEKFCELHPFLKSVGRQFARHWWNVPAFQEEAQAEAFREASRPLFEGLALTNR